MARAMGMKDPVDPVPHHALVRHDYQPTLEERLMQYVEDRLSHEAVEAGLGSFEEEDDFELDDDLDGDPDLLTAYQEVLMPEDDDFLAEPTPPFFPADQQAEGAPEDPAAAAAPVGTEGPEDPTQGG